MITKIIALSVASFLLISCIQSYPGISDPSTRIEISGVSVLPPQEQGWLILQLSTMQLTLRRQGSQDASYVVNVSLFRLSNFESEEQFLKQISEGRLSEPQTGRFTIVKNDEEIFRGREASCMKYHTISEDHAARTASGEKVMLTEIIGYNCQHPKSKKVGVNFEYSHRHYPGDEDLAIKEKASEFLEQVKFTDF